MSTEARNDRAVEYYIESVLKTYADELLQLPYMNVVSVGRQGKMVLYGGDAYPISQATFALKECVDLAGTKYYEGEIVANGWVREIEPLSHIIDIDPGNGEAFFLRYGQQYDESHRWYVARG